MNGYDFLTSIVVCITIYNIVDKYLDYKENKNETTK